MQIGILGLLFIVFLVLKLCGVIAWSWWLVTLPLWGAFVLGFFGVLAAVFVLAHNNTNI